MTGRGMDKTAPAHAHPRRQRRLATLLGLALVSGSLGAGALSLALFTDSQAVTGNAFATGTIDISTTPATALFSVSNMMPGDTSSQTIVVNNAGTGALRYAISTAIVSGPTLAAQLQLASTPARPAPAPLYNGALGAPRSAATSRVRRPGDRALAGGSTSPLCFKATLPLATGNSFQNTTTNVTFTFDAEQTANN